MRIDSRYVKHLAACAIFSVSVAALAAEPPAAPKAAEKTPPKPKVLVTISKETTCITEPLRSDGYPDYVAALNERSRQGVTPENNAAVLLWKTLGPGEIDAKDRETFFHMLGIPPLPEKGDYYVDWSHFAMLHRSEFKGSTEDADAAERESRRQFDIIRERPWSKQEFPVCAKWVEENEKSRATFIEATNRPRCYQPHMGNMVIASLLPDLQQLREIAWFLVADAMYRLGEGKTDQAWEDLLACHRLARLVRQDPSLVGDLIAIALEGIANSGDQMLLEHGKLSSDQIAKMRADLACLPPSPKMADKLDVAERFLFLDVVSAMAREGIGEMASFLESEAGKEDKSLVASVMDCIGSVAIDWDVLLRMGNSWYDRIHECSLKPTRLERAKAWDGLEKDLDKLSKSTRSLKTLVAAMLDDPRKAVSERVGGVFFALLLPALSAALEAEDRSMTQNEMHDLAFALAAYRADHGSYPEKLGDLSPSYARTLPKDLFNGADLHYRVNGDGYLLYSVGPNGKDDDGKSYQARKTNEDWDDLIIHMPAAVKP